MNNSPAWTTTAYGHQHGVENELAGYRRPSRPPDDLSGEQIHDDSEVEPALPGADIRNIRNPRLVWTRDVEIALQEVWDQLRGLGRRAVPDSIPSNRSDLINAHQPHYAVLAARLAGLPKIEEYSGRAVDTVACRKRRADQPQEPNVLDGSLTDEFLNPGVVPAWSHLQHPAHRSNVEPFAVGFDKIRRSEGSSPYSLSCASAFLHAGNTVSFSRPQKAGKSTIQILTLIHLPILVQVQFNRLRSGPSTHSFDRTIADRILRDPAFRHASLHRTWRPGRQFSAGFSSPGSRPR